MLLTLSKKANQWLGKFLLKHGIKARLAFGNGVIRDNPHLDALLLLPMAMRLVSLEAQEQGQAAVNDAMERESSSHMDHHTPESLGEIRLKVLEAYVRPALVPTERWSDVAHWRFHQRLVKWIRKEYLLAKYRDHLRAALTAFPALRQSPQLSGSLASSKPLSSLSRLFSGTLPFGTTSNDDESDTHRNRQKYQLPASSMVRDALDMHQWNDGKNLAATGRRMSQLAQQLGGQMIELNGGAMRFADVPADADLSKLSLEDILEVAGSHVAYCGPLNVLCEQTNVYQLWTREYIDALGAYLRKRTASFEGDTVVLEVGAGDGLLTASLAEYFEMASSPLSRKTRNAQPMRTADMNTPLLVATDDKSWGVDFKTDIVRTMSVQQAIEAFPANNRWQVIVLCSWMPMNEDWTAVFRKHFVDEYILIGECDDGQCGDNWLTWGNQAFLQMVHDEGSDALDRASALTPRMYEQDGYTRKNMDKLAAFQFGRFDCKMSTLGRTVSFRRKRHPLPRNSNGES